MYERTAIIYHISRRYVQNMRKKKKKEWKSFYFITKIAACTWSDTRPICLDYNGDDLTTRKCRVRIVYVITWIFAFYWSENMVFTVGARFFGNRCTKKITDKRACWKRYRNYRRYTARFRAEELLKRSLPHTAYTWTMYKTKIFYICTEGVRQGIRVHGRPCVTGVEEK